MFAVYEDEAFNSVFARIKDFIMKIYDAIMKLLVKPQA